MSEEHKLTIEEISQINKKARREYAKKINETFLPYSRELYMSYIKDNIRNAILVLGAGNKTVPDENNFDGERFKNTEITTYITLTDMEDNVDSKNKNPVALLFDMNDSDGYLQMFRPYIVSKDKGNVIIKNIIFDLSTVKFFDLNLFIMRQLYNLLPDDGNLYVDATYFDTKEKDNFKSTCESIGFNVNLIYDPTKTKYLVPEHKIYKKPEYFYHLTKKSIGTLKGGNVDLYYKHKYIKYKLKYLSLLSK